MKRSILTLIAVAATLFTSSMASAQIFPNVTLSPNPLDFSDVLVGATSPEMTITATATGGSLPTYIFGYKLGNSQNFEVVNDQCTDVALADGDSCTMALAFLPTQRGHYSTTISLLSLSQTIITSAIVEGNGVAPAVMLSTTAIDFGDQTVNKTSGAREILMSNTGNSALAITEIAASTNFGVTDDCGDTLAAGSSCNLDATFTPDAVDTFTGTITITDDASDSPQTITLSGDGVPVGTKDASISRDAVDFGSQLVNTTSAAEGITLSNTGTVVLTINSIAASANFAVTDDCGATLAVDGACTISGTFTPNQAGAFTGTLTIDTDAAEGVLQVALSGTGIETTGPQASLSANALDFGDQTVNTRSDAQTVTITNSGDESLSVEDVQTGGENPEGFDASDDCVKSSVAPGGTCQISVTFEPDEKGTLTATITITDNSASSPQVITLSGVGIDSGSSGGGCSMTPATAAAGAAPIALLLAALAAAVRRKRR